MAVSHVETFNYNNWTITQATNDVYSSGTSEKLSSLYPINKVIGNITASVRGGYGWCSAYDENYVERGDSLYCILTATVYLVAKNSQKIAVKSASGSATRGGYLNLYDTATSGNLTFNTASITDQQKSLYEYIQIGYKCITSSDHAHVEQVGSFSNGDASSPSGSASLTVRDTINVNHDGTDLTNLYFDGNEMASLSYDGTVIF